MTTKVNSRSLTVATAAAATAAALVAVDIKYIKDEISEIKAKLDTAYVTQTEFKPVRTIVYGMVGTILVAVMGGLLTLVIIK
jgi:hypothetical protein